MAVLSYTFLYKAVDQNNKITEGVVESFSAVFAKRKLRKDGFLVLWVTREKDSFFKKDIFSFFSTGFSKMERIIFFRNFAAMLASGMAVVSTLHVLREQAKSARTVKMIKSLIHDVENGQKLSVAMSKFKGQFPVYLTEIVNVGEVSGELSGFLENIASTLERDYEISRKVISAMMYPLIVISLMLVVMMVLLVFVLPQIQQLYDELKAPLPLPTKIIVGASLFVKTHPISLGFSVLGFIIFLALVLKTKRGKYFFHALSLKLPFFGELIKDYNLARFFRGMEALLTSGVSLLESIKISKKTVKNTVYTRIINTMETVLVHGVPLSDALKPFPKLFPSQSRHMVKMGEEAGKFETAFRHTTNYYERSIQYKIGMMNTFLEPMLILIVGIAVGALGVSIFLPIYQVSSII